MDPGGDVPHGLGGLLSRGAASPRGQRRRILDGRAPGHCSAIPAVREGDRLRDGRGAAAARGRLPRCRPRPPRSRLARVRRRHGSRAARRRRRLVGVPSGRLLEATRRQGTTINGRDNHPVTHVAFEDVEAYAAGRASRSPPRRSGSVRLVAASKAPPSRGATSTSPRGSAWRTPGRGSSRGRT